MAKAAFPAVALSAALLAGCGDEGLSTAEAERAAEQQVREKFDLGSQVALDTQIFVGRPRGGETVLCGTVSASGTDAAFPPQRFVAATDPSRWLVFEPAHSPAPVTPPDRFADWAAHCTGARGDGQDEPLAPTPQGEGS